MIKKTSKVPRKRIIKRSRPVRFCSQRKPHFPRDHAPHGTYAMHAAASTRTPLSALSSRAAAQPVRDPDPAARHHAPTTRSPSTYLYAFHFHTPPCRNERGNPLHAAS